MAAGASGSITINVQRPRPGLAYETTGGSCEDTQELASPPVLSYFFRIFFFFLLLLVVSRKASVLTGEEKEGPLGAEELPTSGFFLRREKR